MTGREETWSGTRGLMTAEESKMKFSVLCEQDFFAEDNCNYQISRAYRSMDHFVCVSTEPCKILNWNRSESRVAAPSGLRHMLRAAYCL